MLLTFFIKLIKLTKVDRYKFNGDTVFSYRRYCRGSKPTLLQYSLLCVAGRPCMVSAFLRRPIACRSTALWQWQL